MDRGSFSHLADSLLSVFEKKEIAGNHKKIIVNPLVSKFASWYEKLRNAMDYREEEVILRAAIERILKRRIILGGDSKKIAEPLVRELIWARYFPDDSLSEDLIGKVEKKIALYTTLRNLLTSKNKLSQDVANEWMYQLLSSDIEYLLNPMSEKQAMSNFMYQIIRENVSIADDTEQNKDVQIFIAIRRAFAKDDIAFLRYHLLTQFLGRVTEDNIGEIAQNFSSGMAEVQKQLTYSRKDRIYSYVKSRTGIFLILEDLLHIYKGDVKALFADKEAFAKAVFDICSARYSKISARVRTAIIRSVIFILLTKVFFAFAVEGTFESIFYGKIMWSSILINTGIPPLLMIVVALFLRTPGQDNSKRILTYIETLLSEENPKLGSPLIIKKNPDKRPILNAVFTFLWLLTYLVTFGAVIFVLTSLELRFISQAVFLFFLAIVSFLSYRIGLTTREYTVEGKQKALAPIFDFFFMPIIRVGRHLTEGISQINVLLFVFDFIIETPFKGLFAFMEQWFFFLHAKREEL